MGSKAKLIRSTDLRQPGVEAQERDRLLHTASEEEIRRRAYEIHLERGAHPGHELEDWLQAERELATNSAQLDGEQHRARNRFALQPAKTSFDI